MTEQRAEWLKYKTWSGIRIKGTTPMPVPETDLHMDRAAYLATSLESPKMGAVQSYDRAAMSGGPFHFTAIQPKPMVQGSLFQLLRHLEVAAPCDELDRLWAAFELKGWFVARDSRLRNIASGAVISASRIRDTFTPPGGKVPKTGVNRTHAVKWARLFHNLLAAPTTFVAQREFAISYLLRTQKSYEQQFYGEYDLLTARVPTLAEPDVSATAVLQPSTDLALCVYHAHSVNAPGPARKCLQATEKEFGNFRFTPEAARYLIWRLGRYKYGRWQDTADGRNRYDHTRHAAMRSGLWSEKFFKGPSPYMPVNLSVSRPANTKLNLV